MPSLVKKFGSLPSGVQFLVRVGAIAPVLVIVYLIFWKDSGDEAALTQTEQPGPALARFQSFDCEQMADEVVVLSQREDVRLLEVRNLNERVNKKQIYLDRARLGQTRDLLSGKGKDGFLLMECTGDGMGSDGGTWPVKMTWVVDSDGDDFIYYKAIRR